jgi:hypothetical protein
MTKEGLLSWSDTDDEISMLEHPPSPKKKRLTTYPPRHYGDHSEGAIKVEQLRSE